jgi:fructosamine-3-kinase
VDLPERVTSLLNRAVVAVEPRGAALTGERWRLRLAEGVDIFVKSRADAPDRFFAVEAAGLRWLAAAAGGPPVPEVLGHDAVLLALPWLDPGPVTREGAARLGRQLAALHAAGAQAFGGPAPGWIGAAELDNGSAAGWPEFYAQRRIEPYVRRLRDSGELTQDQAAVFTTLADRLPEVAGPPEPPARLHGDLWGGNVLWAADGRAWLIDPAAHGGHRETDLAMLDLFGAPELDTLLAAYQEVTPLAAGWRGRTALHQVHPLLVHAVLFGGGYLSSALDAARRFL